MSCSFRPFAHAFFSYIPRLALTRLLLPSTVVVFRSAGCVLTYAACPPGPCPDLMFSSRQDFCSRLSASWVPSKEVIASEKEGQGFNTKHASGNAALWGWLEHLPLPKRKLVKIFFLFLTFSGIPVSVQTLEEVTPCVKLGLLQILHWFLSFLLFPSKLMYLMLKLLIFVERLLFPSTSGHVQKRGHH